MLTNLLMKHACVFACGSQLLLVISLSILILHAVTVVPVSLSYCFQITEKQKHADLSKNKKNPEEFH